MLEEIWGVPREQWNWYSGLDKVIDARRQGLPSLSDPEHPLRMEAAVHWHVSSYTLPALGILGLLYYFG